MTMNNVMTWIKSRIIEPTTWVAVGLGAVVLSAIIPALALAMWCVAAVTIVAGIFMKEKGQ
jgi:hypothetical protein|tara:strand:+ start:378 stop:560 length:183 start_codon:yes stop_codon:yes gene_type:complete